VRKRPRPRFRDHDFALPAIDEPARFNGYVPEEETPAQAVDGQVQHGIGMKVNTEEPKHPNWVVVVPYFRYIEPECERKLKDVEKLGIPVYRIGGCSAIDRSRSHAATLALDEGKDILFIDSDIVFNQQDVLDIFKRPNPVVAGVYSQKRFGTMNFDVRGIEEIVFGDQGPMEGYPINHVGAGFLRIKCSLLMQMVNQLDLPLCDFNDQRIYPFFQPFCIKEHDGSWSYLSEDYAFCERCQMMGVPIFGITRYRLFHLGMWPYGWEEAGNMKAERTRTLIVRNPHFLTVRPPLSRNIDERSTPEQRNADDRETVGVASEPV